MKNMKDIDMLCTLPTQLQETQTLIKISINPTIMKKDTLIDIDSGSEP